METKKYDTLEIAKSMVKWQDELSYRTETYGGIGLDGKYNCTRVTRIGNNRLTFKQKSFIQMLLLKEKTVKSCQYEGLTAIIDGYKLIFKYGALIIEKRKDFIDEEAFIRLKKAGIIK